MKLKQGTVAGIGGLIGASLAGVAALRRYDFSIVDQMQQGIGFILGGFIIGAILGYLVSKK